MVYDKRHIEFMAKDVDVLKTFFDETSDVEITEAQAEEAHEYVLKKMETFVMDKDDTYDYLLRGYFETQFDYPEEG